MLIFIFYIAKIENFFHIYTYRKIKIMLRIPSNYNMGVSV